MKTRKVVQVIAVLATALAAVVGGYSPARADVPAGCWPIAWSTQFADVTGDGKADAIAVNTIGVAVRPSSGHDFPVPSKLYWTDAYYGDSYIHQSGWFADLTADGKADAIVANANSFTVRFSTGSTFLPNWTLPLAYSPYGDYGTYFADVTGDGRADAIQVNASGITVEPFDGTRFLARQNWTTEPYYGDIGTYAYEPNIAFADVTGDGKADAIVVNTTGITVRPANATGTGFLPNQTWSSDYFQRGTLTYFADVTGDGKADAIVVNSPQSSNTIATNGSGITVRPSNGRLFLPQQAWTTTPSVGDIGNYFVDVTGDHIADAVVVNKSGITVLAATGTSTPTRSGGFLPPVTWTMNSAYWGDAHPGCIG